MKTIVGLNRTLNILFNKNYKEENTEDKDINTIHELYKRI